MAQRSTIRLSQNPDGLVRDYSALALQAAELQKQSAREHKRNPLRPISHSENPPAALERGIEPYASEFPFELIRYAYTVPPTYNIENEEYAKDIAKSMLESGWTGRPLWGMFDEENSWEEENGDSVPVIELRTGSHRWFALGILEDDGEWPANLPSGYLPVVIMRRSEVSPAVWESWAEADWYEMKELAAKGIGPKAIVQLMRTERNPRASTRKLHRAGDLAEREAKRSIQGTLETFTRPLDTAFEARDILLNPKLHEPTPIEYYELWDMTVGAGKRIAVNVDLGDSNRKAREYYGLHPMAKLERRTLKTGNENPLTDRAHRYRANRNAPPGPRKCAFCGATEDVQVGHLDGHEENDSADNLVWNCRSCNAILSHQFKKLGLGRRTRQYNPALTWQQYGLAAAAMSGRTDAMPAEVGREIVLSTPPAERSRFMKEIAKRRFNPREYKGEGAINLAQWVQAVGQVGRHRGSFISATDMTEGQARQLIHDTPPAKRREFNREIRGTYLAQRGEVPF